ncbi:MAG: DUF2723 domain-containing protein [Chloroflexi bacterium]|nr:DUF2723 domain-containing protein [Chloroflexota bacterium]
MSRFLAAPWPLSFGVGLLAFAAYVLTLSRGVLGGDAGELQFVPPILGLTHPTGYPLQVLVHFLWSYLPFGSVAYRLNLLDAAFAAAAVGATVALTRSLGAGPAGAALAGLCLAFGELWWSQAVRGDKYTLNGLFLALVLWLFVRWRAAPSAGRLAWLAVVYGVSLTHHRSMALVAPALLVGLLLSRWRPRLPELATAALLAASPLLLYAYLPWAAARGLPPGSWTVDSPLSLLEFLLDRGYTSALRPDAAFRGRLLEEAWVLVRSFGPLGALLGMAGLVAVSARRRIESLVLLLAFAPQAVLAASYLLESNYQLPRHWVFYLPAFLIWSVWLGLGVDAACRWLTARAGRIGAARLALPALVAIILLVQAGTAWMRGALMLVRAEAGAETMDSWRQDFQRSPVAERFGRLAFELTDPDSIIVCDWEQATVLWYFQQVEGQRRDIAIVYPVERLDDVLQRAERTGQTVYLSRTLPGVEDRGVASTVGPLLRVSSPLYVPRLDGTGPTVGGAGGIEPAAYPPHARELFVYFEGGLDLVSISMHTPAVRPGSVIPFTLFWKRSQPPPNEPPLREDITVSVRLLGPDGTVLAAHDDRPALGTSRSSRWPEDVIVGDYRELPVGSRLRPGAYRLAVVPYLPETRRNVPPRFIVPVPGQDVEAAPEGVTVPIAVEPRTLSGPLDLLAGLLGR